MGIPGITLGFIPIQTLANELWFATFPAVGRVHTNIIK